MNAIADAVVHVLFDAMRELRKHGHRPARILVAQPTWDVLMFGQTGSKLDIAGTPVVVDPDAEYLAFIEVEE